MAEKLYTKRIAVKHAKSFVAYLRKDLNLDIKIAFLYGSYAKGNARRGSDIDVCIVAKGLQSRNSLQKLWSALRHEDIMAGIEPVGFNLTDFNYAFNPLAAEIKKTGIKIF